MKCGGVHDGGLLEDNQVVKSVCVYADTLCNISISIPAGNIEVRRSNAFAMVRCQTDIYAPKTQR